MSLRPPSPEELNEQVLWTRLKRKHQERPKFSLKALTATRVQSWMVAAGVVAGAAIVIGPWMWQEYREAFGFDFVAVDPTTMPRTSPEWWENEWRKMNPWWRAGDTVERLRQSIFPFIKQQTGRDASTAEAFIESRPSHRGGALGGSAWAWPWQRKNITSSGGEGLGSRPVARALVPLCGDTPVLRELALSGYEVDGIESSETAIRAAVERTERGLPLELYDRVHLRHQDFFSPTLWDGPLRGVRYDFIYERQGMTSLNRDQRSDYAYLLKRALKDDGVLYVEGIFRTGRVKGNKIRGPPYSLTRNELRSLFPDREGFFVRCEEKPDAVRLLTREDRVLRRVPKELHVTPFNCVVFREAAANLDNRNTHTVATEAATPAP